MIDTIINYCSVDSKFIEKNIRECLKFSDNIIIPVCDHLFDGAPEDMDVLNQTYKLVELSSTIQFVEYEWNPEENAKFHHNMSRWISLQRGATSDYVLFLDADEHVNGDLMYSYVKSEQYKNYDVVAFECYWYFRESIYRATTTEMAPVLYRKALCDESVIFHPQERWAYRDKTSFRVKEHETYNNQILCDHYSWVRTKEEMLKKVVSWAHSSDKDWTQLVNTEFDKPFTGTDFIHGYQYETVERKLPL